MQASNPKFKKLLAKYKEISLLAEINRILSWDLNVNLPSKASMTRAGQAAYLAAAVTEKWLDKDFYNLFENLRENQDKLSQEEKAAIRNLEWAGKFYFRVPKEMIVEKAKTASEAFMVWQQARNKDSFSDFRPYLEKIVGLDRLIAERLGYKQNPYDALLDLFEPQLTVSFCNVIFGQVKNELVTILKKIKESKKYRQENKRLESESIFPQQEQRQIALYVLRKMGYDLEAGRMDISTHPFTDTLGFGDVRMTNRYKENDFKESLLIAMHEGGHALYEQGVKQDYQRTPLEGGVSLGIHESQSRFWENQIGRSKEFLRFLTPVLHAFYPEQLLRFGEEEIFGLFNRVNPGLIRTEADEVTYNLHIILRFELEEALISEKIKVADLPLLWREKMKKYLGIEPKTDREGVLQDVHWASGSIGYFPTYTLGNLYAAQITHKLKKELNLGRLLERGELGTILSWLRTNIHQYGSLYWPDELIKKVTSEELNPKYFIDYLNVKYGGIYRI